MARSGRGRGKGRRAQPANSKRRRLAMPHAPQSCGCAVGQAFLSGKYAAVPVHVAHREGANQGQVRQEGVLQLAREGDVGQLGGPAFLFLEGVGQAGGAPAQACTPLHVRYAHHKTDVVGRRDKQPAWHSHSPPLSPRGGEQHVAGFDVHVNHTLGVCGQRKQQGRGELELLLCLQPGYTYRGPAAAHCTMRHAGQSPTHTCCRPLTQVVQCLRDIKRYSSTSSIPPKEPLPGASGRHLQGRVQVAAWGQGAGRRWARERRGKGGIGRGGGGAA